MGLLIISNDIIVMWFNQIFLDNIEIITAVVISIFFAFLVWSVKESYRRHGVEMEALKKVEIILAINLGSNSINKSFFSEWQQSLKNNRLYQCSFRSYTYFGREYFGIHNLELVNKVLKLDFAYKGLDTDLNKLFGSYHETSIKFLDGDHVQEWLKFNTNILNQNESFKISFVQAEEDTKEIIAFLRAYYQQKKRTPYGLVHAVLGKDLFPKVSLTKVTKEKKKLEEELEEKRIEATREHKVNTEQTSQTK